MTPFNPVRRQILRAAGAAGSLFLPDPFARVWAQSEGTPNLLRVPKIALVIGNGKYRDAPLRNPANDAKAIGDELRTFGFEVTQKLEADRAQMAAAVRAYVAELAKRKCVGLFYYAGHGVQLAWRNYMLPVDAAIGAARDIPEQGLEVNGLLEGLSAAANPMNLIILDACRDNPFGDLKGVEQKGLSQMDAPQSTLLAYATSPGNVAIDGAGANGLYTENLLKEMKVPEAKIEDVFKRVRLGVRRRSNGLQIPWESTSLEDDFWFLPPKNLVELSDAERDRQFDEEFALWEQTKNASAPEPLEAFLRRFPSGNFAELAQLQLDRSLAKQGEKRIEAVAAAGNPFTQGFVRADTGFKPGDSFSYVQLDRDTREEQRRFTSVVQQVTDTEVIFGGGLVLDRLGNTVKTADGRRFTPRQDQPLEYAVGRKWSTRFTVLTQAGGRTDSEFDFRIARREKVTVPAGTFDCFVIEGEGVSATPNGPVELRLTRWMAPDQVRRPVITEQYRRKEGAGARGRRNRGRRSRNEAEASKGSGARGVIANERIELVGYKQS